VGTIRASVLRFSSHRRAVFVGDAKATETAGTAATLHRLARYVAVAAPVLYSGSSLWFVVAHGSPQHAVAWADTLRRAFRGRHLSPSGLGATVLDADLALAWAWVSLTVHTEPQLSSKAVCSAVGR